MPQKIVKVPAEGDCFFHVVAYFRGAGPGDALGALQVRRALAREAARQLFKPPYDDLSALTGLVSGSTALGDLAVVQPQGGAVAASLRDLHANGPFLDPGNGGGLPLAVFVVWMQFNVEEIGDLRKGGEAGWLRAQGFLNYTIWGDAAFTASLVRLRYDMAVDVYTAVNLKDLTENAANTVNLFLKGGNHFDAAVFEKGILPHIGNLTLEIHHLDIGQGDSTLIVIRDFGEIIYTVLIDAADAGEAPLIHEYMNRLGVISLDTLVITHYDKDHFRGALALLTHSKICQRTLVFDRGDPEDVDLLKKFKLGIDPQEVDDDRLYEDEIAELKELLYGRGQKQRICAGKKPNWMVGKELVSFARPDQPPVLTLTCVAANGYILGGGYVQPQHRDRENAMSLCLLLRFGSFVYYFGGDAPGVPSNDVETAVGNAVLAQLGLDHICGMKASHHGSHHSTLPGFVDLINPTCAFISCGIQHGHPRQQAIDTLEGTPGLQNYYMTRCAYRRNHITPHNSIQKGKARVAGDESTLGTIVLRIEQSTANDHVFYVGYWDREAATWRLNRHCCTHDEIYEEITFVEETPEELAVTACEDIHPGEHAQESVLLEDAIERQRAARDEELVRGFGVRGRDARRSLREDDEPAEPPPPPKTIQTEEMVDELDERYEREMQQKEDAEYDDDDEYS